MGLNKFRHSIYPINHQQNTQKLRIQLIIDNHLIQAPTRPIRQKGKNLEEHCGNEQHVLCRNWTHTGSPIVSQIENKLPGEHDFSTGSHPLTTVTVSYNTSTCPKHLRTRLTCRSTCLQDSPSAILTVTCSQSTTKTNYCLSEHSHMLEF